MMVVACNIPPDNFVSAEQWNGFGHIGYGNRSIVPSSGIVQTPARFAQRDRASERGYHDWKQHSALNHGFVL